MKNNISIKRNLSSMQVIKTLKVLLEGDFTMQELIKRLNANEKEPIFNNSVISKYINTCRYCGIEIPKIHNKYFLVNMPFGIDLSIEEVELLKKLKNVLQNNSSTRTNKVFDSFLSKVQKYSNKQVVQLSSANEQRFIDYFETAILEKRKINLMYKSCQIVECVPIKIVNRNNKLYFNIFYNEEEHFIDQNRISGIEILNTRFVQNYHDMNVVFELKDALAKRYTLREHEHLAEPAKNNKITVANVGEDKDELFSRLLRYDDKCKILFPKSYKAEMKQIIDDTLKNYGE